MSSFLAPPLSCFSRSNSVTDYCHRTFSNSSTSDESIVAKLRARTKQQSLSMPKMKFPTSSLTAKDMRRHLREKRTLEAEIQRARSEHISSTTRPIYTITNYASPMKQSVSVEGSPRKLLGKRPSFASISTTTVSTKPPSPETPQIATPLISTPLLEVPEQGEFFGEAQEYFKSVGDKPREFKSEPEVHADFLGISQDGTAQWATSEEGLIINLDPAADTRSTSSDQRASTETIKPRPVSFKAKRPKINVVIPENVHKKRLSAVLKKSPSIDTIAIQESSPSISTVSAFSSATSLKPLDFSGTPVSALSTVSASQPKPPRNLRPFSRYAPKHIATLQMARNESPELPLLCHSSTASSDDDLSSNYSRKSSMSSVTMEDVGVDGLRPISKTGSVAFSIVTPAKAGVYDELIPPPPRIPARFKKARVDLSNKPLPPEPKDLEPAPAKPSRMMRMEPDPLRIGGLPPSRFVPPRQHLAPDSPQMDAEQFRKSPRRENHRFKRNSFGSLKSKFTANDLDALDHAFQRALPPRDKHLTLEEAEIALEIHLSTITERCSMYTNGSGVRRPDSPTLTGPLQISRGPMQMSPSRPAPSPPPMSKQSKAQKRGSFLSINTGNLMIKTPALSHRSSSSTSSSRYRHSTALDASNVNWASRTQKTLDKVASGGIQPRLRPPIQSQSLPHSPDLPLTGGTEEEQAKPADPAVLEIHRRLELLQLNQNSQAARIHDELSRQFLPQIHIGSDDKSKTDYAALYPPPPIPDECPPAIPERSSLRSSRCKSTATIRSLASLAVSDIPDLYANMPPSETPEQLRQDANDRQISPSSAESILLNIFMALDNLQDLFSAATVSKGFYRTFKRHELSLMKNALRKMSPPAWELREVTPPVNEHDISDAEPVPDYTPSSYLQYYTRDLYIMVALKQLILVRCKSFLRSETIAALTGKDDKRSLELDNAFWRVWTFCKIFGSNKQREDEIVAQVDWLRGGRETRQAETSCRWSRISDHAPFGTTICASESFGKGNCQGLDEHELWDMTEIWVCLGVLLRGFLKPEKRQMAREFGIFDGANVVEGDHTTEDEVIEEWTHYLLTLGPTVILDLATPSTMPSTAGFEVAAENGWTDWTPPPAGVSRSSFLKFAMIRLYQAQVGSRPVSPSKHLTAVENKMKQARDQEDKIEWFKALRRLGTPTLLKP